ncbi:MAG: DNA-directed RNA polymerase subunit omega [Pseudomonadota bacterium]|nr:DNA-directed RNA polymerase subunit omega [Pseudomonadota bacterium]MEC8996820.1 DNA-directed RNA polymerase subunit omega [Pseudomonadota bacterium]MED5430338.1 DNA-directed RNA polymerase subunit omega [Pseudomonadota bacterium]|tara:strand:- start:14890 stop:15297 length:408 start_codon:yes stop_codon:yes gene_type:complete
MARVTIEDCLENIDNAFDIVTLASRRAKDLIEGSTPLIDCKDKPTVVALREIAASHVGMDYFETSQKEKIDNKLQDAISEEEIISEISQGYEAAEQADLEKTVEASEPTDNDSLDESQNIEEEPSTEVKEEGKQE